MAIYHRTYQANGGTSYTDRFMQDDALIYGSKRLGNWQGGRLKTRGLTSATAAMTGVAYSTAPDWTNGQGGYPTTALSVTRELGLRRYELSNHLGNVLSTVSDCRLAVASGSVLAYYRADEKSYADYDPYGMLLPGRFGGGFTDQKFGFQAQLKDDELNGSAGTSYAFEYRVHDPRVGRFLSVDPLAQKYPYYSSYAFSGNRVIDMIEFEGLEPDAPTGNWILEDNQGDKYGRGCQILLVSTTSSDVIWELARYQIGNSVVWMYADRSKAPGEQWSRFWPKTGTSEVQTQQYVFSWPGQVNNRESERLKLLGQHDAELGARFPNMMSKGLLISALAGSTLLYPGALMATTEQRLLAGGVNILSQQAFNERKGELDYYGFGISLLVPNPVISSAWSGLGTWSPEAGWQANDRDVSATQFFYGSIGGLLAGGPSASFWRELFSASPSGSRIGFMSTNFIINFIGTGLSKTESERIIEDRKKLEDGK
jgi:RHS repeat-associated protein